MAEPRLPELEPPGSPGGVLGVDRRVGEGSQEEAEANLRETLGPASGCARAQRPLRERQNGGVVGIGPIQMGQVPRVWNR